MCTEVGSHFCYDADDHHTQIYWAFGDEGELKCCAGACSFAAGYNDVDDKLPRHGMASPEAKRVLEGHARYGHDAPLFACPFDGCACVLWTADGLCGHAIDEHGVGDPVMVELLATGAEQYLAPLLAERADPSYPYRRMVHPLPPGRAGTSAALAEAGLSVEGLRAHLARVVALHGAH